MKYQIDKNSLVINCGFLLSLQKDRIYVGFFIYFVFVMKVILIRLILVFH